MRQRAQAVSGWLAGEGRFMTACFFRGVKEEAFSLFQSLGTLPRRNDRE